MNVNLNHHTERGRIIDSTLAYSTRRYKELDDLNQKTRLQKDELIRELVTSGRNYQETH